MSIEKQFSFLRSHPSGRELGTDETPRPAQIAFKRNLILFDVEVFFSKMMTLRLILLSRSITDCCSSSLSHTGNIGCAWTKIWGACPGHWSSPFPDPGESHSRWFSWSSRSLCPRSRSRARSEPVQILRFSFSSFRSNQFDIFSTWSWLVLVRASFSVVNTFSLLDFFSMSMKSMTMSPPKFLNRS